MAFAVALTLLFRLAALELDRERAEVTLMLIAFCPMAYFFSAVYSESIYPGAVRRLFPAGSAGPLGAAGVLGALAAASRNSGVMLTVRC